MTGLIWAHRRGRWTVAVLRSDRGIMVAVGTDRPRLLLHVGAPWEWPWTHRIPGRVAFGWVALRWRWERSGGRVTP